MYQRAKAILLTDMVRVPLLNGIATIIRMITGLISVKVVANLIGPAGIALVGQLNNFSQILMNLSNGGILSGMVKYISENKRDRLTCQQFISTGFKLTLVLSLLISAMVLLFRVKLTMIIFHDPSYEFIVIIMGLSLIFFSCNAFINALLNGYQEYKKFIYVNIAGSITGLAFSVFLALRFGLPGALIASVTYQSVVFLLTFYLIRNASWYKLSNFTGRFRWASMRKLSHFSLMAITSALTVPAAQFIVRSTIVQSHSIHQAGLWEGINRISGIYLMVATTSLGVYYLPRLSQLKTGAEIREEAGKVYRLMIPFLLISSVAIYLFRHLIIRLLFSNAFEEMETLFAVQMTAETIKISGYLLGYMLIAKTMTKIYIYLELQNFVVLSVAGYFLVRAYGAWGACVTHIVAYTLYLLAGLYFLRKILFGKDGHIDHSTSTH